MPALITPASLQRAVSLGFDRLTNFRKARYMFVEEYAGAFYDKADPGRAQPLNLIFKAVSILVPHLVAKNPEHDVQSRYAMYMDYAEMMSLALDDLSNTIGMKDTLRNVITDAIFGMGCIKTGLSVSAQGLQMQDGMETALAQPYAGRVDLDDLCVDPMCRNIKEAVFIGNRVRVPREFMLESGLYESDVVAKLPSVGDYSRKGREVETLTRKNRSEDANDLVDYVDIVEAWLPDDRVIVTLPFGESPSRDFMRVVDYEGPDTGPYHFLGFHWAPNNPFPIPPAGIWYDLHIMANDMARKASRQANRAKEILVYGRQAADDAQNIVDADDGDSVAVDNPQQVSTVSFGGGMDEVYQHLGWVDAKFSESGPGDLSQLGGESSKSDTATQAGLLAMAANVRIGDMKDIIYDFTAGVSRDLAWYLHTDPLIEMPLVRRMPGGEQITLMLTPEARRGDFLDYHFKITQESMDRDNPMMRSQKLTQFVQTVVPTAIQTFIQLHTIGLGGVFNFMKFITINAKLQGINNFEAIWNDPEFQVMIAEQLARAPIMPGSVGMPGLPGEGQGQGGPQGQGFNNQVVPDHQGAGLDPTAAPEMASAQMGSAPMQAGMGNRTGLPGGGLQGL